MFTENDIQVVKHPGPTMTFLSDTSATGIYPGEPLKLVTVYAGLFESGDPEVGTDAMMGIARKASSHTSAADGTVEVITMIPGRTILRWNSESSGHVDTQAKIDNLQGDVFSCSISTNFYLDSDDDDPNVHGFGVIGGDPIKYTLDTFVSLLITFGAPTA